MSGAEDVPKEWLEGSAFDDYFIPGPVLFVVVGGAFLAAAIAVFAKLTVARAAAFIWLVANNIGDHEPLSGDPVNVWAGTLILAIALDLGRQHAPDFSRPRSRAQRGE